MASNTWARRIVRYGLYPAGWVWIVIALSQVLAMNADERPAWILITLPILLTCLLAEWLVPMQKRWSMSRRSILADIVYVGLAGGSLALLSTGLAMVSITVSNTADGPARAWPLWLQVPVLLLVFEFMNYWLHRAMHELPGHAGRVLWGLHAAHHLPRGLYVLMHAVSHPLNVAIIQSGAIILPIWIMGYQPEAVLIFLVVNAFHGIISHFNVDLRLGPVNYLFVGPELHRYHHSADTAEALNYGATLSVWDQVFGTFVYRPNDAPDELGTDPHAALPDYRRIPSVLALPFRRG
jgi:sterol desaturase/sphingolipid hydroxylase (fatty acid hydroxylase superfamily)